MLHIQAKLLKGARRFNYFKKIWPLYCLLAPAVVYMIVFAYIPIYGILIAFKDYKAVDGIFGSRFVGLYHFKRFFNSPDFLMVLKNTLAISIYSLLAGFPVPILLAFMLNELRSLKYKKTVQLVIYAPYFVSTVAVCGIITMFLKRETGLINILLVSLGKEPYDFLSDPRMFRPIYILSGIWQSAGWGTIIYLAALSGVDPEIHEAAYIDGANKIKRILNIDFPTILPIIIIQLILSVGSLLSIGFEKILLLQTPLNLPTSEVIPTLVYRVGIMGGQFSYTTAVGLFNSVINCLLLVMVNELAKRISETSLW